MIRRVVAVLALARLSASLALVLLEGASLLLEVSAVSIAMAGLAPVGLVARAIGPRRGSAEARRDESPETGPRALTSGER